MEKSPKEIKREAVANFKRYMNFTQAIFLKTVDLDIVESDRNGVHMKDIASGQRYIDCFCSAGSFNVGRRNPEIVAALEDALEDYGMGDHLFPSAPKAELAEKLVKIAPEGLNRVMFCSGGGEAIDSAVKMARGATGRSKIVSMILGYHGHTGFALSAIGKPVYRDPFEPLMPDYVQVPLNDLAAVEKEADERTAAIMLELVLGEAGIYPAEEAFVKGLRRICDERGAMLIFDEVQTGFGRTGKMFCCQHYGVAPDIMAMAKSLGGSVYPIAATLYGDRVSKFMEANPNCIVSTTGGANIGCAVGAKVIDYLVENKLPEHAAEMGEYIGSAFERLAEKHGELVKAVRRKGLMMGLEYTHDMMGPLMSFFLAQNGVMAIFSGNNNKVMRFMPPLVIDKEQADYLIAAADRSMASALKVSRFILKLSRTPLVNKITDVQELQAVLMMIMKTFRLFNIRPKGR